MAEINLQPDEELYITEHAVVRYMERIMHLDIDHIKTLVAEGVLNGTLEYKSYGNKIKTIIGEK